MKPDLPGARRRPLVDRFSPDAAGFDPAMRAHDAAIAAGQDGYLDPSTGAFVFTAAALWDRRRCCGSGCRHCPFESGERAGEPTGQPLPGTE